MKGSLTPARLEWKEGAPVSLDYEDVYFSRADGLAETVHVFLEGNDLAARLTGWSHPVFTIGETGFGTGLNLLAAWRLWKSLPVPKPRLHFITLDLQPLSPEALARAHAAWPNLAEISTHLRAAYPPLHPGMHRRWLEAEVQVDFLWGEARDMLARYQPAFHAPLVDAWFLDGFSPARNPAMWRPELYAQLARLSAEGATVATFTCAGHVRRGLEAAGFAMRKTPGHGQKREMLRGRVETPSPGIFNVSLPRFEPLVIGAGIAGVGAAWQLAQAGANVRVIEAGAAPCAGASGNPASVLTPYFTADWSPRGQLYASGFAQTLHLWGRLAAAGHPIEGARCGTLVLDEPDSTGGNRPARHAKLSLPPHVLRAVGPAEASEMAGLRLHSGGYFYPQGGWLRMESMCRALMAEMGQALHMQYDTPVARLSQTQGVWTLYDREDRTIARTDRLVLACGAQAAALMPGLPLQSVRGQLLRIPSKTLGALGALRCVLRFGEYLTPERNGEMILGATFGRNDTSLEPRHEESRVLLQSLRRWLPELELEAVLQQSVPWVGTRCATPRRMPLMGWHAPGLYLSLGHGSRGSLSGLYPHASK